MLKMLIMNKYTFYYSEEEDQVAEDEPQSVESSGSNEE